MTTLLTKTTTRIITTFPITTSLIKTTTSPIITIIRNTSTSSFPPPPPPTQPLPPNYPGHIRINYFQNTLLAVGSAITSLIDPSRHDMIAVLSETTSGPFLARLRTEMRSSKSGRNLLRERPRITSSSVDLNRLKSLGKNTLGWHYVDWLSRNKVTPDTRDPVQYIEDEELAYIMQRYRESHDFYHVLLTFGVSLPSELVVKWFELSNFSLPVALLSSIFGPLRLEASERNRLARTYGIWALRAGGKAKCLIGVEWEKEWEKDIDLLRGELGVELPDVTMREWRAEGKRLRKEREIAGRT